MCACVYKIMFPTRITISTKAGILSAFFHCYVPLLRTKGLRVVFGIKQLLDKCMLTEWMHFNKIWGNENIARWLFQKEAIREKNQNTLEEEVTKTTYKFAGSSRFGPFSPSFSTTPVHRFQLATVMICDFPLLDWMKT